MTGSHEAPKRSTNNEFAAVTVKIRGRPVKTESKKVNRTRRPSPASTDYAFFTAGFC